MFLADSHTHSNCSPDGTVPMTRMAQGALQAGLSCLCLTDHCDFLSLDGSEKTPCYDWAPVLAQWREMRMQYGSRLALPLGLELGMGFLEPEAAKTIVSLPELDFVIGAVHNLSEEKGGKDFYFIPYDTQGDCYLALDDYVQSMLALARSACYDVLGHIIYPLRYMKGPYDAPISWYRYTDQLTQLLRLVVEAGRGIEVNTWKGQTLGEWLPILKLYKQCGGEIITVGSDAHAPETIGAGIKDAYTMLEELGFRYVTSYVQRKPQFRKLR